MQARGPAGRAISLLIARRPQVKSNDHNAKSGLVVKNSGFSLHAAVATKAHERDKLEKICRYIARPAVSEERLSLNTRGEVVYKFKKPWDQGHKPAPQAKGWAKYLYLLL